MKPCKVQYILKKISEYELIVTYIEVKLSRVADQTNGLSRYDQKKKNLRVVFFGLQVNKEDNSPKKQSLPLKKIFFFQMQSSYFQNSWCILLRFKWPFKSHTAFWHSFLANVARLPQIFVKCVNKLGWFILWLKLSFRQTYILLNM